jgi:hypothetical protein
MYLVLSGEVCIIALVSLKSSGLGDAKEHSNAHSLLVVQIKILWLFHDERLGASSLDVRTLCLKLLSRVSSTRLCPNISLVHRPRDWIYGSACATWISVVPTAHLVDEAMRDSFVSVRMRILP